MDFEALSISVKYNCLKFLSWKYQLEYRWMNLSYQQKITSTILFGSATSLVGYVAYKACDRFRWFLESDTEYIDFEDELTLSRLRKSGLPPGLYNEGNTCFVNSTLQALASFSKVLAWVEYVLVNRNGKDRIVITSLRKLLTVLSNKGGNEEVYSAMDLINSLRGHGWVISDEQHDAYEFYQTLLSTVEDEVTNYCDDEIISGEVLNRSLSSNIANRAARKLPIVYEKHLSNPLKGSLANRMTCLTCGYQLPVKFESFNSIILNLQNITPLGCTLEYCFEKFTEVTFLKDVSCEACEKKAGRNGVRSTFKSCMSLAKLPSCLCIELQRTRFDVNGRTLKNSMFVKFPEFLDVTKYTYQVNFYSSIANRRRIKGRKLAMTEDKKNSKSEKLPVTNDTPEKQPETENKQDVQRNVNNTNEKLPSTENEKKMNLVPETKNENEHQTAMKSKNEIQPLSLNKKEPLLSMQKERVMESDNNIEKKKLLIPGKNDKLSKWKQSVITQRACLLGGKTFGAVTSTKEEVKESTKSATWYRLNAVILHYGNAYDGHFVTYRRSTRNPDKWMYISDESSRFTSKENVFKSSAYMLFYEKM